MKNCTQKTKIIRQGKTHTYSKLLTKVYMLCFAFLNTRIKLKELVKYIPCKHEPKISIIRGKAKYFITVISNPPGICDNSKFMCVCVYTHIYIYVKFDRIWRNS